MARFTLSQTWSVGPVAVTISAVGDPAPEGWAENFAPIVAAIEEALTAYESDAYPIMRKVTGRVSEDLGTRPTMPPNGEA